MDRSSAAKVDPWDGCTCPAEGRHLPSCPANSAASLRRIVVTHTASHTFDQAAVDAAWKNGPPIPHYLLRGDEDTNPDSRAMTLYEAYGDSLIELFNPWQDDDTGYEVEDYDPEA